MKRILFRSAALFGFSAVLASMTAFAAPAPTPGAVLIQVDPLLELSDPDVPVGSCQVEVDCPHSVAAGSEILCEVIVLQKVQDAQGKIDFKERRIPPQIWRKNKNRAFAWEVDVSRLLPNGHCLLSRNEEPFTFNNRFRLKPDSCPASYFVGARPIRYFPTQTDKSVPYACEIPAGETEPVCNLLRDLDARKNPQQLAEELGCTGELLIKSCKVDITCPPATPTPTPKSTPTPGGPTPTSAIATPTPGDPATPTPHPTPTPPPGVPTRHGVPTPTPTPPPPPTPALPTPTITPKPTPTATPKPTPTATPKPTSTPAPTPTRNPPPPPPTLGPPPTPTATFPIIQDPAHIIQRDNGMHAVEMHGRIEVDTETFDPNVSGVTWQLFINGQKLVEFGVPPGGFEDLPAGVFSHQEDGARTTGGIEFLNFSNARTGGEVFKAVKMKGYSTALGSVVGLPSSVTTVPAQIAMNIPGWGTFSTTGVMKRSGPGMWTMSFPLGSSILDD